MHGLLVLACGLLLSAPSADDVHRALRNVVADPEIQTTYPSESEPFAGRGRRGEGRRSSNSSDGGELDAPTPASATPQGRGTVLDGSAFASTLLWVLVGVGTVLLVVWLAREVRNRVRPVAAEDAPSVARPCAPPAGAELADASSLAAAGCYEEAVHLLLLHVLRDVERGGGTASSHTSREVVVRARLGREAHEAVLALVGTVELSHFGGRPVDEAGYLGAVAQVRRFQATRA